MTDTAESTESKPENAGISQDDLNRIISDRLAKASAKHEAEMQALREEMAKGYERAKMADDERIKLEREDERNALTRRAEEAEHRLRLVSAERELARSNLPVELAEAILGRDDKATAENITLLAKAVEERANAIYSERMGARGAPEAPTGVGDGSDEIRQRMRLAAGLK